MYEEVELCLAETDRDWSKCQQQLKTFQACFDAYVDEQKRKRADVANKFASILSGAAKAQLVASVPGLSPRAPSKGGGFEYF